MRSLDSIDGRRLCTLIFSVTTTISKNSQTSAQRVKNISPLSPSSTRQPDTNSTQLKEKN